MAGARSFASRARIAQYEPLKAACERAASEELEAVVAQLCFPLHRFPMQSKAGKAFRKFLPLFDRVLVERCAAETVTKGGIMIPEKAQGKVLQATVVAVGSGARGKDGEIHPVSVKVGEKVLLPEYGGTKIVLEDKVCFPLL